MAFDVFLSYSSKDKAAADAACAMLESAGVRTWIAPRDVRPGVEYGAAIVDAIEQCRVLILIFSSSANNSGQILREVERAVSKGIPIVPVRIEGVLPTKSMEYFLGTIHWLEALTPPLENHLRQLVDIVKAILASDGGGLGSTSGDKAAGLAASAGSAAGPQPYPSAPSSHGDGRRARRIALFAFLGIAAVGLLGGAAWLYQAGTSGVSEGPAPQVEALIPETIPFISDLDRGTIRSDYLTAPDHKALAISDRIGFASGQASEEAAKSIALATCEKARRNTPRKCELYAVGTTVVLATGRPPMPPAPWVVRNPAVEQPFVPNQVPLAAGLYKAAMERYAAGRKPKAIAVSQRGYASFYNQGSQDEATRRALEFCGSTSNIACLVAVVDDVFVVAIPTSMKPVGLFHAATEQSIAPDVRSAVASRLANATNGWSAVAVGGSGRPGLMLRAASEREAVDGALADCGRQDRNCRIIAIGPFLVETIAGGGN